MNLKHVGGVFLVLFVGIGFSFAFTLFELVWEVAVKSIKENVSEQKKRKILSTRIYVPFVV